MHEDHIEKLIKTFSRLPGLGPRSGRRVALHLLKRRDQLLVPMIEVLQSALQSVNTCQVCYNLDVTDPCHICQDPKRQNGIVCVVADVADLWALERAHVFRGTYHILGGILSAMEGLGPTQLKIEELMARVAAGGIQEVVLALNATLEGQTTLHYLADRLHSYPVKVSTLAHGVPVGGELDYLDDGTLSTAFGARKEVA